MHSKGKEPISGAGEWNGLGPGEPSAGCLLEGVLLAAGGHEREPAAGANQA